MQHGTPALGPLDLSHAHGSHRANKNSLCPSHHLGYPGEGPIPCFSSPTTLCLTLPCPPSKTLKALLQSVRHFLAQSISKSQ